MAGLAVPSCASPTGRPTGPAAQIPAPAYGGHYVTLRRRADHGPRQAADPARVIAVYCGLLLRLLRLVSAVYCCLLLRFFTACYCVLRPPQIRPGTHVSGVPGRQPSDGAAGNGANTGQKPRAEDTGRAAGLV